MPKGEYKNCLFCGEEYYEYPYLKGKKKYCSKKCVNLDNAKKLSKDRKGKGNPMFGKRPWNYNNGISKRKSGSRNIIYKTITKDGKSVVEHRIIMEKMIGRKLKKNEVVHHKNGNGLDNREDNLELMTDREHNRLK